MLNENSRNDDEDSYAVRVSLEYAREGTRTHWLRQAENYQQSE